MNIKNLSLGLITTAILVGCGGGGGGGSAPTAGTTGGGGSGTTATASAVVITESTAKPIGAHASQAAQSGASSQNALSLTGVQVEASEAGTAVPQVLWAVNAARSFAAGGVRGLASASGVVVNEPPVNCTYGGTIKLTGNVASEEDLTPGDVLTFTATGCNQSVNGVTSVMNGTMTLRFNSFSETATTFAANLTFTATSLSIKTGSTTVVMDGEQTLDMNETTASTTLAISGAKITSTISTPTSSQTTSWIGFRHAFVVSGTTVRGNVSGTVESNSTRLGASGGSYTVSTPADLVWSTTTGAITSGTLKIVGAANSQMQITYSASGATVAVDANGDGTYEKNLAATADELKSLL